jgi:hypothetical protein
MIKGVHYSIVFTASPTLTGNRLIQGLIVHENLDSIAADVKQAFTAAMTKGAGREVIAKLQAMLCGREPWPDMPDAEGALRAQLADGWRPDW